MPYGLPWSEAFADDLADKEFRDEFVADQIRTRIALLIRALREQEDRGWSQAELGRQMGGKPQSVISRLEDPDYGKLSVQTLLETAAAFDLPLWIDMPEWEDWFRLIGDVPNSKTQRESFNRDTLIAKAWAARQASSTGSIRAITPMKVDDVPHDAQHAPVHAEEWRRMRPVFGQPVPVTTQESKYAQPSYASWEEYMQGQLRQPTFTPQGTPVTAPDFGEADSGEEKSEFAWQRMLYGQTGRLSHEIVRVK